ncbi:hypothetical protein COI93_03735 [Bacillus cereus]|uniref:Uncharacterized protein n=1 Tax=Bacillus cereus TaxID=1396 RepID=A0A2B0MUT3_BACCE|nr:hypothetical protein COI93_03735 [Bacillus cereus]
MSSEKLLETLLTKPGGLELLTKLLHIIDPQITEDNLDLEKLQKLKDVDPNELILDILDKPAGFETLLEIANFAGINTAGKNITVDQIKQAFQPSKPSAVNPIQETNKFANSSQSIQKKNLSPLTEVSKRINDQTSHTLTAMSKKINDQTSRTLTAMSKKIDDQTSRTLTAMSKKINDQTSRTLTAMSKKINDQKLTTSTNFTRSSLQAVNTKPAEQITTQFFKNLLPVQILSQILSKAPGLTKPISTFSPLTTEKQNLVPSNTTTESQTEPSIPTNLSEILLQLSKNQEREKN